MKTWKLAVLTVALLWALTTCRCTARVTLEPVPVTPEPATWQIGG